MKKPFAILVLAFFAFQLVFPVLPARAQMMAPSAAALLTPVLDCSKEPPRMPEEEFENLFSGLRKQLKAPAADAGELFKYAEALTDQEQYEKAILVYSKVLSINPNFPDAQRRRGFAYSETGQWELALKDVTDTIERNPSSAEAYFSRGTVYFDKGDYKSALPDYEKTLLLEPADKCGHNNIALTYEGLGQPEKAIAHYNEALRIDPSFSKALRNRANLYFRRGAYLKSFGDYLRLWRLSFSSKH